MPTLPARGAANCGREIALLSPSCTSGGGRERGSGEKRGTERKKERKGVYGREGERERKKGVMRSLSQLWDGKLLCQSGLSRSHTYTRLLIACVDIKRGRETEKGEGAGRVLVA